MYSVRKPKAPVTLRRKDEKSHSTLNIGDNFLAQCISFRNTSFENKLALFQIIELFRIN